MAGVETEFGSMKPKAKDRKEKEAVDLAKRKKHLESQTAFLGATGSEAHRMVVDLIDKQLIGRIDSLIREDPEASAYKKILLELGVQRKFAEQAARDLEKIYLQT